MIHERDQTTNDDTGCADGDPGHVVAASIIINHRDGQRQEASAETAGGSEPANDCTEITLSAIQLVCQKGIDQNGGGLSQTHKRDDAVNCVGVLAGQEADNECNCKECGNAVYQDLCAGFVRDCAGDEHADNLNNRNDGQNGCGSHGVKTQVASHEDVVVGDPCIVNGCQQNKDHNRKPENGAGEQLFERKGLVELYCGSIYSLSRILLFANAEQSFFGGGCNKGEQNQNDQNKFKDDKETIGASPTIVLDQGGDRGAQLQ